MATKLAAAMRTSHRSVSERRPTRSDRRRDDREDRRREPVEERIDERRALVRRVEDAEGEDRDEARQHEQDARQQAADVRRA